MRKKVVGQQMNYPNMGKLTLLMLHMMGEVHGPGEVVNENP